MTAATLANSRYAPPALGVISLVVAIALIELLIRLGVINRFIVRVERLCGRNQMELSNPS